MDKWFYAYRHLKKRLEGAEKTPLPEEFDSRMVFGFIEVCLNVSTLPKGSGKFDRAWRSINELVELLDTLIVPNFQGNAEWFPMLLGLKSGLLIAQHQLNLIKQKGEE